MADKAKMTRSWPYIVLICIFLSCIELHSQIIGMSRTLEGQAAILRATEFIIAQQQENGSWCNSSTTTAIVADALIAVQSFAPQQTDNAIGRAIAWLRTNFPPIPTLHVPDGTTDGTADVAIAIRPFLKLGLEADKQLITTILHFLSSSHSKTPQDTVWILDIALAANMPSILESSFSHTVPPTPAQRLAAACADVIHRGPELHAIYSEARRADFHSIPCEELYWTARACQALLKAQSIPYDNWKTDIVTALLDRQRGNGTWNSNPPSSNKNLQESAFAIKTVILCLSD